MNEQAEPPTVEVPTLLDRVKAAPITFLLAAINVGVFVWAESAGTTTETPTLLRFGAMEPVHVWAGEYWRLATCMFLHIGWIHLLWNTYASVGWCASVERVLGKARFLFVYLASGLAGGCASSIGSLIFDARVSAGASGAMVGIVGATLAIRRWQLGSFAAFKSDRGVRSTFVNIAIWTAIGLTALKMDNSAHFGGLVAGATSTWLLIARRRVLWVGFALAYLTTVAVAVRPWWTPKGDDAQRVSLFTYAWLEGKLPGQSEKEDTKWPKDVARGLRIGERGCARGVAFCCLELSSYYESVGDPRSKPLLEKACSIDPKMCETK
jgi:rhomboid protease GluP